MTKSIRLPLVAVVALATFAAFARLAIAERLPQPSVRVGAEAPPLKIMKWVKGEPVKELQEGQVYVMEFWATWCGPCISAMPHITELAKTYEGRAVVIGVNSLERLQNKTEETILAQVEPFVEEKGDKMGYRVAVDDPEEYMANTWFRGAGRTGIPSTFIVGKDKKVAWIGHPMRMDEPLAQIVEGTWDLKKAAAEATKEWEHQQDIKEVLDSVTAALRTRDYKAVVAAIDAAVEKMPETEAQLRPRKFDALLRGDEPAAYAYLKELAKKEVFKKNPVEAFNFWSIMDGNSRTLKEPDWDTMLGLMEEAIASRDKSYTMIAALAAAYSKTGKFDKAAETQQKAIDAAAATQGESQALADWIVIQKRRLAEYKSKLE